jgi:aspartyl-tRNA(Asn)/glutamyl-tRNA(Gln) amidotransferase subunit C
MNSDLSGEAKASSLHSLLAVFMGPDFRRDDYEMINLSVTLPQCSRDASRASMSVDEATVRHVAKLARIAVSDAEVQKLAPELSNILGWVEQLGEVNVEGVAPMTAVIPNTLRLREDVVTEPDRRDEILANAPLAEHGFFAVPKVIE